jgi:hypothetical protein
MRTLARGATEFGMEPAAPDDLLPSGDQPPSPPGERSGSGIDGLFKLIADEQRRRNGEDEAVPIVSTAPSPGAASIASTGMNQAFDDWLRTHRELMALELAFTDLAMRAAVGEVSAEELAQKRAVLLATRELCSVAYKRAFPARTES